MGGVHLIFAAFLIGGTISAVLFYILIVLLGTSDLTNAIWISTSIIVAAMFACVAWIVKTIGERDSK